MRRSAFAAVGTAGCLGLALLAGCSDDDGGAGPPTVTASPGTSSAALPTGGAPGGEQGGRDPVPEVVGVVADHLAVPWGVAFLPDGTALVTERDTRRVLAIAPSGRVREVGLVEEAAPQGEAGLLGIAVPPDWSRGDDVFLYVTTTSDNRILRAPYDGRRLGPTSVVLDGIPAGFIHDGGRLAFGPDGYLYASTGETGDSALAQDRGTLAGKILRITTDGEPAPGNPDPGSPVWTWGHRNVQGLAFDDERRLWASEFGDQTFDELNLIEKGDNYGWPEVEGRGDDPAYTNPQVVWETAQASPSGLAWLEDHLWLAALRGERLWRITVTDGGRATDPTDFFVGEYGRLRTVVPAPDGSLWVTTSNRDGRGTPAAADDRILRVELR
ncbi:PQQ-dependent sugar dehydrogenase [Nocardioides taihuensis]|uniref:PQQ-dependent sugar dehydrogenase n=1 Tax=Nocardioides taihuensis TaxID=1835606 RepID=A0ABW0BRK4_9ACTN